MKNTHCILTIVLALVIGPVTAKTARAALARVPVEVAFVLDTTGSMSGLIEGAKEKIWAIAGGIIRQNQGAPIRMALVGYRDRGDAYITKIHDLTDDLDHAYGNLRQFTAEGGGDAPESVNQALYEAVTKLSWSGDAKTLRVIFLVGDCPPHMDYQDDVKYHKSCELAMSRGIFINTVQCGNDRATTLVWREIARMGEGAFNAIAQDGGMKVVATPFDDDIAALSRKLDDTVVAFGHRDEREQLRGKISAARTASYSAQAERQMTNALMDGRVAQGKNDLVQEIAKGNITLDKISDEEMPDELKKMSATGRKNYLAQKKTERDALNRQLMELGGKRAEYIAAEAQKQPDAGASFDAKVAEAIAEQLTKVAGRK